MVAFLQGDLPVAAPGSQGSCDGQVQPPHHPLLLAPEQLLSLEPKREATCAW